MRTSKSVKYSSASNDSMSPSGGGMNSTSCYASQQTYVEVNDTYSEGGTHEETLRPQRKAKVMNKRRGD